MTKKEDSIEWYNMKWYYLELTMKSLLFKKNKKKKTKKQKNKQTNKQTNKLIVTIGEARIWILNVLKTSKVAN